VSFLLDTNVVSEWMKLQSNPGVVHWLANVDEDRVFISVVTLTEIRYGIERMAAGARRKRLEDWVQRELPVRFEGRILPVDEIVADAGGRVVARSEAAGRPVEAIDAFLAATAQAHNLTLVTRNQSDFKAVLKTTLSPWS
jgi:predicted nucleic acid-binding protein